MADFCPSPMTRVFPVIVGVEGAPMGQVAGPIQRGWLVALIDGRWEPAAATKKPGNKRGVAIDSADAAGDWIRVCAYGVADGFAFGALEVGSRLGASDTTPGCLSDTAMDSGSWVHIVSPSTISFIL